MDILSLAFLVLLVVLGGVIAYGADWLGRKLGKKRTTLGKMRPKRTAAVLTTAAGMTATLLTIVVLIGISEPVRVWLLQGRQALWRLEETERKLAEQEKQYKQVEAKLKLEEGHLKMAQLKASDAEKLAEKLRGEAAKLSKEVATFREKLASVGKQLSALKGQYASLKTNYGQLETNRQALIDDNKNYAQKNLELDQELQQKKSQAEGLEQKVTELDAKVKDLDEKVKGLGERNQALTQQNETAAANLATTKSSLESAKADLAKANNDLKAASDQIRLRTMDLAMFRRDASAVIHNALFNRLLISTKDELARIAIKPGLSRAEARDKVLALLENASKRARELGAVPEQGSFDAAQLVNLPQRDGSIATPDIQIESALDSVANATQDVVLIAHSIINVFDQDFAPIMLTVIPNRLVYMKGHVLAETRIDGHLDEQSIAAKIGDFVRNTLSPQAVKDGMIPAKGQDNPLGEIASDQLMEVVRAIKGASRVIRLQFVAAENTRAADPIRLEMRLK